MTREGKRYRFRDIVFWADSGMICWEDVKTGEFAIVLVREFLLRAHAILGGINRLKYASEREEQMRFVEEAIKACRQAKEQGRPDDPAAVADMINQRRKHMLHAGSSLSKHSNVASAGTVPEGGLLPPLLGSDGQPIL